MKQSSRLKKKKEKIYNPYVSCDIVTFAICSNNDGIMAVSDQKPGFNFQTVPKLNVLVHFLAFASARDHWFPMKVATGQFS